MKLQHGVCSVAPPVDKHRWIEMAPGHFVHYLDYFAAIDDMNKRRQQFAAEHGVEHLEVGETLDMFNH